MEKRAHQISSVLIPLIVIVAWSCGGSQTFSKHDISFQIPSNLKLEEWTLDIAMQFQGRGPTSYDQGAVTSTESNFMLLWVYEPTFTTALARRQVLNGPAFFESINRTARANLVGSPTTEEIAGFEVTYAEMKMDFVGTTAPAIIGTWQCQPSERAIIFIAIHKQPTKELNRFVRSFSCS